MSRKSTNSQIPLQRSMITAWLQILSKCVTEGWYWRGVSLKDSGHISLRLACQNMPSFSCSLPLSKIDESIGEKMLAQPWKESTPAGRLPTYLPTLRTCPVFKSDLPLSVRGAGLGTTSEHPHHDA